MNITDPIADMLTRIRNAQVTKKDSVTFEASRMKKDIAQILLDEGYINSYICWNRDWKSTDTTHSTTSYQI